MPIRKTLPFSLDELCRQVDTLDTFVKAAALQVMTDEMGPDDLGFPSTIVDELAHLHGLLDLARCCVQEIEIVWKDDHELGALFRPFITSQDDAGE